MNSRAWLAFVLVMSLAGGLLFHSLSYRLLEPDEGRYAEIGREMVASGDWIMPRFNRLPYLDKPPLFYWFVAASVSLFGAQEWAVRLVPSLATWFTILATFFFGRRLLGTRRALLGTAALTLMGGVILVGRMLILDAVMTLFVIVALFAAFEATRRERLRRGWWIVSACSCGLAMLVKGPVALALLVPPVLAYGWLKQQGGRPRLASWLLYGAVVMLVTAPWFVAISSRCPEFPHYFFVNQHLVRYLGQEHHPQPFWYYVPVLLGGCFPWTLLLVPLALFLFGRRAEFQSRRTDGMGFLILCAGWCLAFFSASSGKLPPYILPAFPPLALLIGCYLEVLFLEPSLAALVGRVHRFVPRHTTSTIALGWIALLFWSWQRGISSPGRFRLELVEVVVCLGAFFGVLVYGGTLRRRMAWVLCGGLGLAFLLKITTGFLPAWSEQRSPFCRAGEIEALVRPPHVGVAFMPEFGSIPFLLAKSEDWLRVPNHELDEVKEFLRRHPRSLFVADRGFPPADAQAYLPAGMHLQRYFDSGKTRFFVLGCQPPPARPENAPF